MKKPKGFFVYFHHANIVGMLSDVQAGRLIKALMAYGDTGEIADFPDDGMLNVTYTLFKDEIDRNFEKYNETCNNRSEAAKLRAKTNTDNKNGQKGAKRFMDKMTKEEIDDIEEAIRRKNAHIYED